MTGLKVVFGAAGVRPDSAFDTQEKWDEVSKALLDGGCDTIDTATLYGPSEELLSKYGAPKQFTLDTKTIGGFKPGHAKKEQVIKDGEQSQKYLGNVDIWYIHSPPSDVPLEETLEGVNEMYKRGFFKRFGISNFKPEAVQEVYDICKAKGYPLPSVYQGNYNAVARIQEQDLFPVLRKLKMSFYVYSPLAGGFLTKTKQEIADGKGRFSGEMYSSMYARTSLLEALAEWESIAKEEGAARAELAYRWVAYNSPLSAEHGDAVIFGASSLSQVKQTLESLKKGPLSDKATKRIDEIWEKIKHEAPRDNFHR